MTTSDERVLALLAELRTEGYECAAAALQTAARIAVTDDELQAEWSPSKQYYRDVVANATYIKQIRQACAQIMAKDMGIRLSLNPHLERVKVLSEYKQLKSSDLVM